MRLLCRTPRKRSRATRARFAQKVVRPPRCAREHRREAESAREKPPSQEQTIADLNALLHAADRARPATRETEAPRRASASTVPEADDGQTSGDDLFRQAMNCFYGHNGATRDAGESIRLLERAAEKGSVEAMFALAKNLLFGIGGTLDERRGTRWLQAPPLAATRAGSASVAQDARATPRRSRGIRPRLARGPTRRRFAAPRPAHAGRRPALQKPRSDPDRPAPQRPREGAFVVIMKPRDPAPHPTAPEIAQPRPASKEFP